MRAMAMAMVAGGLLAAVAADGADAGATTLRGVLAPAGSNAAPGVVAVLVSRTGSRPPVALKADLPDVGEELRERAAAGAAAVVTGIPAEDAFTVTAMGAEDRRRRTAAPGAPNTATNLSSWLKQHWAPVPGAGGR